MNILHYERKHSTRIAGKITVDFSRLFPTWVLCLHLKTCSYTFASIAVNVAWVKKKKKKIKKQERFLLLLPNDQYHEQIPGDA